MRPTADHEPYSRQKLKAIYSHSTGALKMQDRKMTDQDVERTPKRIIYELPIRVKLKVMLVSLFKHLTKISLRDAYQGNQTI